jgi:glycosyltransferase involved in cell wall biosynthesis
MMNFTPLAYDVPLTPDAHLQPAEAEIRGTRHAERLPPSPDFLRHAAWEIGERKAWEAFGPTENHVGLGLVAPHQGFAHWRIRHDWIEETRRRRGDSWNHCRMILRLYDVSFIEFTGLNAHSMQDHPLPGITGQLFYRLPRPGTTQIGEVGFLLRSGEFIPAARSQSVAFAADSPSRQGGQAGLLVTPGFRVEPVGNVWDQERILRERERPQLRKPLRLAFFTHSAGRDDVAARFVRELAAGQARHGHEVHIFAPAADGFAAPAHTDGIHWHPLDVRGEDSPVGWARAYAAAAQRRLNELPSFDLHHLQEWMTGLAGGLDDRPCIVALSSIEATRRNGAEPTPLSQEIERAERLLARGAGCVLTADWLRERAAQSLGIESARIHAFPMEGRLPNEWEAPLDQGQVKMGIGFGPLDRMALFVGPLEHAAGVDLLIDSLPVVLQRANNFRVALVGNGQMHGYLEHRARELGVSHAVRLLGHVGGQQLIRLLRSSVALVLPSRYRVPQDDGVVDLARRASRPVITTHGGPAHLIKHEENGILTYDNPGSMVWAFDRILGDPHHADRMGRNGRRGDAGLIDWDEVARRYGELCAHTFPSLTHTIMD